MSKKFLLQPLAVAALLGVMGSANAELTVYTSSASFLAAVTAASTDGFNGFNITGTTPSPITRNVGPYGYTATAANGFFGGGTTADPYLSTNDGLDTMGFGTLTGGASAVGANWFGSNVSGLYAAGSVTVSVSDSLGGTFSQTITPTAPLTGSYLGFVSNGVITSFSVVAVQPGAGTLWPTVDNLTLAVAVPEPGTYAMFLAGIGALGFMARRRRG